MSIRSWPLWARRLYLLTAPISVPLHLTLFYVAVIGVVVLVTLVGFISLAVELWER
jgi:hypothetical protein